MADCGSYFVTHGDKYNMRKEKEKEER